MMGVYEQFFPANRDGISQSYTSPPAEFQKLNSLQENDSDLIRHDLIDLLGETTNALIFCFLDNHVNERFTRVQIRAAVERHVAELKIKGVEEQYLARIQTGKAAVNYWIDRLVENNSLEKKHSKPVLFWRSTPYQSKLKSFRMSASYSSNRGV